MLVVSTMFYTWEVQILNVLIHPNSKNKSNGHKIWKTLT
jgi:hypothetical protein